MRILFNDAIQYSDAPDALKSPALSETASIADSLAITLDKDREINCIGIGNTDGSHFTVNGETLKFTENGLYLLKTQTVSQLLIVTDATFIGRIAAGIATRIGTAVAKEPAFASTSAPRRTLSGQVVMGLGGYNYRTLSLDSRYRVDEKAMSEMAEGYPHIAKGYPFFIDLSDEAYKLPFSKLYAIDSNQQQFGFEGGIRRFLYSRRWQFRECF